MIMPAPSCTSLILAGAENVPDIFLQNSVTPGPCLDENRHKVRIANG